jgi:large subunit ribosomal protein L32
MCCCRFRRKTSVKKIVKDCAVSAVIILMRVNAIAIKSRLTQGSRFLNNLWIDICYCKEVFVMAVPKRKTSHARKSSRRSTVWKLNAPTLVICPNCGEYKAAHRACGNCGMYNGRQVIVKANEN